jgi:hypothetical protein
MTGSVIIDGLDMYESYKCFLLKGGDQDLLVFPERKEPDEINWFEKNGVDVDLEDVAFKAREVRMSFYFSCPTSGEFLRNLDTFYRHISSKGYREVFLRELNRTFLLRFLSCEEYSQRGHFSKTGRKAARINVVFSCDDPLQVIDLDINTPVTTRPFLTYVMINSIDLCNYGIIVKDIYTTALPLPAKKAVLEQEISNGVVADVLAETTFEPYEIVIECSMLSPSLSSFYNDYSALFYQLSRPGTLSLRLSAANKTVSCYYTKQDSLIKVHAFSSGVNISFKLYLKAIDFSFMTYLLGTETRKVLTTENGKLLILA